MTSKKYFYLQLVCIFGIVLFSLMDVYLYKNDYFEAKKATLKYQEKNDIDYKVYLKKNDFFDTKYLEKDKTYITSLIDHINVDYNYNIEFDHPVDATYKYYVYVTLESNKTNSNSNYWTKDYKITDEKKMNVKDVNRFGVHENLDIDYNKYNSILMSFKKTLGLGSAEGVLKVQLKVESEVEGNNVNSPIDSVLLLKMPLTEMTVEASVDLDEHNTVKELTKIINTEKLKTMRTVGVIYACASVFCIVVLIYITKKKKDLHKYDSTLKKILTTYDGIIVNVDKLPDLTDYKVIDVSSFEELLDAHSEIRMPINFFKDELRSYFILLNDKTVWRYTMSKRKIERM